MEQCLVIHAKILKYLLDSDVIFKKKCQESKPPMGLLIAKDHQFFLVLNIELISYS